jgi:sugar lactone lactonase YvrE
MNTCIFMKIRFAIVVALASLCLTNNIIGQTIITVAGGIGDNQFASYFGRLGMPTGIAVDGAGNVYIADKMHNRIRKVNKSGIISTIAGTGFYSTFGSFRGEAVHTEIGYVQAVGADAIGNVYVTSENYNLVGKVDTSGMLTIIAGSGVLGFGGDGGIATNAQLNKPSGIAADVAGNVYIADRGNNRIRKVNSSGIISTVAGGGTLLGDGGPAISANLNFPTGLAVDTAGNIYIADENNARIRKVNTSGIITTIAGGGSAFVDGGSATATSLGAPDGVAIDAAGNIYIADRDHRVRVVSTSGVITTIAGNGILGFSGDGGPATAASLFASDVKVDAAGNVYVADEVNNRIRKVNTAGIISTVAGNGLQESGFGGDGQLAALAEFNGATAIAIDPARNIYIADNSNNRIRKINASGLIYTIAGNGIAGFSGDGSSAIGAELDNPVGVALDRAGNVYIADQGTGHIRKINTSGIISTIAGGGSGGLGDGGPATASVISAYGLAIDSSGNIFIADRNNDRVRKIDATTGIITSFAGGGSLTGDGVPATSASLSGPNYVATDEKGNVYISFWGGGIRKVDAAGIITTLSVSTSGKGITTDKDGNLYFTAIYDILKIDTSGHIDTLAGYNTEGYMGDCGPARAAEFIYPTGLTIDDSGHIYITDYSVIRCIGCAPYTLAPSLVDSLDGVRVIARPKNNFYTIFPNPATGEITISWQNNADNNAEVIITDVAGRRVYNSSIIMPAVNGTTVLNINNIVSGMYIVTIRSANGYFSGKLVVL